MSLSGEEQETLDRALRKISLPGTERAGLRKAAREAVEQSSVGPLLAWAHGVGESHARSGEKVAAAIRDAHAAGEAFFGFSMDGPAGEDITSLLVGSAAEGYVDYRRPQGGPEATGDQLRDRVAELTALHRVISAANSSLKLSDMLSETAQAVVAVTRADICSIFLYNQEWDQLLLTATSGLNRDSVGKVRLQVGEGITGWAAMLGKPIAIRDAWEDPRFKYVPALLEERAVSILAVPVVLFTKEKLVGVITVHTFEARDFTSDEVKFLETVAGEIAIAIENARLYEQTDAQLRQKVTELTTLQGVSASIAATLSLPEVLALIAHQAAHLVHADAAAIYELHPEAGALELVAMYDLTDPNGGPHSAHASRQVTLNVERSAIANSVLRGTPEELPPDSDSHLGLPFASEGFRSMYCIPLVAPRGIRGSICLYNREERTYTDDQVRLLDAFAHEAAIALENSRLYDAALRGLETKSAMLQEMNHRVRNNLQTVAGLLSMQLRRLPPDSEAAIAMRESISRIQSMAVVHDLMVSGGAEVESIALYELAREVADGAISTLSRPELKLELDVVPEGAQEIMIGSQEATLLALLFNELVSNAILHGFTGLDEGKITIRAWRHGRAPADRPGSDVVQIEVADNGTGLPEEFDLLRDANLGLNIVRTLVLGDLRGYFSMRRGEDDRGTVALISFRPPVALIPGPGTAV